ncbi:MAG: polyamine aminopropyltransferase [Alphaproteobacteria bacterium]|nr:polyamine aminopropyltransferase [Alphaproteobacteria bacterium]
MTQKWFTEILHADLAQQLKIHELLFEGRTEFQDAKIFANGHLGKVLVLDNVVQTTLGDEFVYHEMMAHTPLFAHGAPKTALIIGGGDGGLLNEALKHPSVEQITMVELDGGVVDISRAHMPEISDGAFDDPRTNLIIGDGAKFVAETDQRFDVIMIDSTDPQGPGEVLFSKAFYADCKRCLNPGGILVTQNGVPFLQGQELADSVTHFRSLFADGSAYLITVPTYAFGVMALGWASDNPDARTVDLATLEARYAAAGFETQYYTPEVHRAAFALPMYVKKLID